MRESPPLSPSHDRRYRVREGQRGSFPIVYPPPGSFVEGRALLPPQNRVNLIMGNANAIPSTQQQEEHQKRSNLSVLLETKSSPPNTQQPSRAARQAAESAITAGTEPPPPEQHDEADSASGPSAPVVHANSAPTSVGRSQVAPPTFLPLNQLHSMEHARRLSTGDVPGLRRPLVGTPPTAATRRDKSVRR